MDDIGRYRIVSELGSGGMGVVFRAYDPLLGREVAIKTLRVSELTDSSERDALRERLAREARAAAALSHPGIVAIHDVVQQGDIVGLVMEKIEGRTLANILADGPLDVPTVLRIIRETAAALDYAHRKGIVHRDIKPANLMLNENAAVKVADFGIAKITTSQTRTESSSGLIVGTAGYMSPEQLRGVPIDGRADQFSLAVVAYEMLGLRRPFTADSLIALTHQVVFEHPPTLSTIRPGLGSSVDAVLNTALAKSPTERFATCTAFATALESQINIAITAQTLAYTTAQNPVAAPPPVVPKRRWWPVGLVAMILAGAAGLAYFIQRGTVVPPQADSVETTPVVQAPAADPPSANPPVSNPPVSNPPAVKTTAPAKTVAEPVKPAVKDTVLKAGTVRINKKDSQQYVWIPPGTFTMGCIPNDADCRELAKPAHRVTITNGFWMAQTETTVAAYKAFSAATRRPLPAAPKFNPNWTLTTHPIVAVSWQDAAAYSAWAGGRLPTEAEWEYAARGGAANTMFSWGNQPSHDLANFGQSNGATDEQGAVEGKDRWINTSPVASFPPNGFHLYDMTGNAAEWCADWFSPTYYRQSPAQDPQGPPNGSAKLVRGGSWKSPPKFLHISYRWSRQPNDHGVTYGFRSVLNTLP